jgi:hypothetical protein
MKVKVAEMKNKALDWATAKCNGVELVLQDHEYWQKVWQGPERLEYVPYCPTTCWAQGGPIIERERIALWRSWDGHWKSQPSNTSHLKYGPTPLVAAMRCFVASKLGDEVEVPEELK